MLRDPRYLAPLGVLIGVIVVAAVAAHNGSGRASTSAAPLTSPTAEATAVATATPEGAAVDQRRMSDLVKVRNAMLVYRQRRGKFPISSELTAICDAPSDPGCALAPAPFADDGEPYRFRSDGQTVFLVSRAAIATDTAQCPPTLPSDLTGVPILCLRFERPVQ